MANWPNDSGVSRSRPVTKEQFDARKSNDVFRYGIINGLITSLTASDNRRLMVIIRDIVQEHCNLTKTDGFYHGGKVYTNMLGLPAKNLRTNPIHPSLKDRMAEYIRQLIQLESDQAKIKQGLAVLLRDCHNYQAARNALPDITMSLLGNTTIPSLQRTLPEMHTLTTKVHRNQYEKTMDVIYFYLGSRLLV